MRNKKLFFIETGELQTSQEKRISSALKAQLEEQLRRDASSSMTTAMGQQFFSSSCSICGRKNCKHLGLWPENKEFQRVLWPENKEFQRVMIPVVS